MVLHLTCWGMRGRNSETERERKRASERRRRRRRRRRRTERAGPNQREVKKGRKRRVAKKED